MKKSILLLVVVFLAAFAVKAQNTERPWLIGISTNYADFHAVEMTFGDQLTNANWMGQTLPTQLKIARSLSRSFNFGAEFSVIKLEQDKLNEWPYRESDFTTDQFWRIGGQFEYKFANGMLLKEEARIAPYIFLGMNGSNINEKTFLAQSSGVGLNIWITDWLGVNAEGSYEYVFDYNDYFHYSFGLVAKFGKKHDKDKDGISDKNDACPEVPGIPEFAGCPDSDNDGIQDKDDKCPTVAGPKEFNGCPDTDGDKIIDIEDQCPQVAGIAQFKGCPDTDGDGIPDKEDQCPNDKGPRTTFGCPDTDGDGITDKQDECPNEKGLKENKGCPVKEAVVVTPPPVEQVKAIEFAAKNIRFDTGKSNIKQSSFNDLNNILKIMNEFPASRFSINGYTDNTGGDELNMKLSEDRAQEVKKYFTDRGIAASRLTAKGFGKANPIATNDTPEGKLENRRVEINLMK
jgi:outer membrane protein OmpA-like peptidoglycan-associated protein